MKLEVGKYYEMRNGAKAGPVETHQASLPFPFTAESNGRAYFFREDGTESYLAGVDSEFDLIREWKLSLPVVGEKWTRKGYGEYTVLEAHADGFGGGMVGIERISDSFIEMHDILTFATKFTKTQHTETYISKQYSRVELDKEAVPMKAKECLCTSFLSGHNNSCPYSDYSKSQI
jgi:hypothetical protein